MDRIALLAVRLYPVNPNDDTSCTVKRMAHLMSSHFLSRVSILARLKLSTLKPTLPMSLNMSPAFRTRSLEKPNSAPMRLISSNLLTSVILRPLCHRDREQQIGMPERCAAIVHPNKNLERLVQFLSRLFVRDNQRLDVDNLIELKEGIVGTVYLFLSSRALSHFAMEGPAFGSTSPPDTSTLIPPFFRLLFGQELETILQPFLIVRVGLPEQIQVELADGKRVGASRAWQLPSHASAQADVEGRQTLLAIKHRGRPLSGLAEDSDAASAHDIREGNQRN